jgi:hypothetical protein
MSILTKIRGTRREREVANDEFVIYGIGRNEPWVNAAPLSVEYGKAKRVGVGKEPPNMRQMRLDV